MKHDARSLRSLHDELRTLARELTQTTERKVIRDDHTTTTHDMPPLLEQLREAVATGGEKGKGGGRPGKPSPIAEGAVDLFQRLDTDVAALHLRALQADTDPEERIMAIVGIVGRWTDPARVGAAVTYLAKWKREISTFLDPPRVFDVLAACPACGTRTVWREVDGEVVQVPALQVDGERGCWCLNPACRHEWPTGQLEHLARVIGCDPIRQDDTQEAS